MKHYAKLAVLFLAVIALAACKSGPESSGPDAGSSASRSSGTAASGGGSRSSGTAADGARSVGEAVSSGEFADVANKDWQLAEIRPNIVIDRAKLAQGGFGDAFTLHFGDNLVSGRGAPNTYRAPYTLADNQAVSIGLIASTMMAAFSEPEELKEHEYFAYLKNVSRWNLPGGNLELHSKKEDGTEVVLVFVLEK